MTPLVENFTTLISLLGIVGQFFVFVMLVGFFIPGLTWFRNMEHLVARHALAAVLVISTSAVLGSLFYSEIAGFEPCSLCIIQRWLLYPIPFIAALGYKYGAKKALRAVMLLSLVAAVFAAYQYVLQLQGGTTVFCTLANPCDKVFFMSFGYITIPLLSFTNALMLLTISFTGLRERRVS